MTIVSNTPFALSLSKGRSFGAIVTQKESLGFDKLSPNGFGEGF